MKSFIFSMLFVALTATIAQAQKATETNGVFLTASAYINHQPDYVVGKSDYINVSEVLGSKKLCFSCQGKKQKVAKKQIFGYHYQRANYRLFNCEAYEIVDTAGFYIYDRPHLGSKQEGFRLKDCFYYSLGPSQPIKPLTINNLLFDFKLNDALSFAIKEDFDSDRELMQYDAFTHLYKIKYVYQHYLPKRS